MEHTRVDLRELIVPNATALTSIPLEVALLLRSWDATIVRGLILQEETKWLPLRFRSLSHAMDVLARRPVHILVVHWHVDSQHTFDNNVTQFVKTLKSKRGFPGIGSGPLLVGAWMSGTDADEDHLLEFLRDTYDCHMNYLQTGPDEFTSWLAEQLWTLLPSRNS